MNEIEEKVFKYEANKGSRGTDSKIFQNWVISENQIDVPEGLVRVQSTRELEWAMSVDEESARIATSPWEIYTTEEGHIRARLVEDPTWDMRIK